MDKRKSVLRLIADSIDAPLELLPGAPLMEITGNQRIIIENHCGVREYTCACIRVRVHSGMVAVRGRGLYITRMQNKQLVIMGELEGIELNWGERQ